MIEPNPHLKSTNEYQLDTPFVTIVLPLDYNNDPYRVLDELVKEVKNQLEDFKGNHALSSINKKLNRLMVKLPPQNQYKSLVAFLSEDVEDVIPLNYCVEKKASVGNNFDFEEIQNYNKNSDDSAPSTNFESNTEDNIGQRCSGFQLFGKRTF